MRNYLVSRIISSLLLLVAALTCVFFFIQFAPGNPIDLFLSPDTSVVEREAIETQLGLDKPLHKRYISWISGVVLHGDFGDSIRTGNSVTSELARVIPATLLLTVSSFLIHLLIAFPLGVWMANVSGSVKERLTMSFGLLIYSLPAFWLGLMLILFFSNVTGWLPTGGMSSLGHDDYNFIEKLIDTIRHMVLPVFVLGVSTSIGTARYIRASLLEVMKKDYITAAKARGLHPKRVLWRHALRNSLLPIISVIGLNIPFLLGGAVITETIFSWPGMGRLAVDSIFTRDYPLIMGCVTVSAVMVILGNLMADIGYSIADPRVNLWRGDKQ